MRVYKIFKGNANVPDTSKARLAVWQYSSESSTVDGFLVAGDWGTRRVEGRFVFVQAFIPTLNQRLQCGISARSS
ncbi:MAG: hypothetical protein QNJ36_04525 [Calothrix sp. MO_167.B42]|nr:hypothetical protein [Calothrix sp. MO_167.B42]